MVYKRYIKQNGKSFGPYYYSSHRKGKKVVSKYLPEYEEKSYLFEIFALGFIFLFIMFMFLTIGIDYNRYNQDKIIIGNVIKDIPNTNINSIYQILNPVVLLALFFLMLLFLGFAIKKKREKDRVNRISNISYIHGKEESQKLIQKLLSH